MLRDAGYPIEDVAEEVERIQQRAFEQAALSQMPPATTPRYANYLGLREADPGIRAVPLLAALDRAGQPAHDSPADAGAARGQSVGAAGLS